MLLAGSQSKFTSPRSLWLHRRRQNVINTVANTNNLLATSFDLDRLQRERKIYIINKVSNNVINMLMAKVTNVNKQQMLLTFVVTRNY
jgi:hypothetical protein